MRASGNNVWWPEAVRIPGIFRPADNATAFCVDAIPASQRIHREPSVEMLSAFLDGCSMGLISRPAFQAASTFISITLSFQRPLKPIGHRIVTSFAATPFTLAFAAFDGVFEAETFGGERSTAETTGFVAQPAQLSLRSIRR